MKLPSFDQILLSGQRTLRRFPLVLLSALTGFIAALILIDHEGPDEPTIFFPILFSSILGIPLLFGIALLAERRAWGTVRSLGLQAAGIVLLMLYALTVPLTLSSAPSYHVLRLVLLAVGIHFFAAVGPYLGLPQRNEFWQYNKTLCFRFLGAALYSHILYLGLSLALLALDQLFGLEIAPKRYAELWLVTIFPLNTWLFLSGIPEPLTELEGTTEYPKSLRIFVQYVLLPLAVIYALVIYAYIVKLLVSWQWSDGWISKLILGFAVTALCAVVFVDPLREKDDARWVKSITRWFPIVMIPLVVVFPLALWRRIAEYGWTEGRYVAAVLAVWLIVTVIYLNASKRWNLKFVPFTLGVLCLVTAYGPWSMFRISERSQTARLEQILTKDSILVDGSIRKAEVPVSHAVAKNVSSILDYLRDIHGYDAIQPWFPVSLLKDSTDVSLEPRDPEFVAALLGVSYMRVRSQEGGGVVNFEADERVPVDVKGFDRVVRLFVGGRQGAQRQIPAEHLWINLNKVLDSLEIRSDSSDVSLTIPLRPCIAALLDAYQGVGVGNVPPEKMTVDGGTSGLKARVFLRFVSVRHRMEQEEITSLSFYVAYSLGTPVMMK